MILRVLAVLLLLAVVFYFIRDQMRNIRRHNPTPPPRPTLRKEEVKRCEQCGSHLPESMTVEHQQKFYCPEHAPPD